MKYGGVALTKTSELRAREVICVNDGRKLGLVTDLEIDLETGKIRALVVPGKEGFFCGWVKVMKWSFPGRIFEKSALM